MGRHVREVGSAIATTYNPVRPQPKTTKLVRDQGVEAVNQFGTLFSESKLESNLPGFRQPFWGLNGAESAFVLKVNSRTLYH